MKKPNIIFFSLFGIVIVCFIRALFIPAIKPDQIHIEQRFTPTINYYLEDLYAQCKGLDYFDSMIENNETLKINSNFNAEYQKTLDYIERDKKELEMPLFECP